MENNKGVIDYANRKKVFIICSLAEYPFVYEHLKDIVDKETEELIIPFDFFNCSGVDELIFKKHGFDLSILNDIYAKQVITEDWYRQKLEYFQREIKGIETVKIITNYYTSPSDDIEEKMEEMRYLERVKSISTIENIDAFAITRQKCR